MVTGTKQRRCSAVSRAVVRAAAVAWIGAGASLSSAENAGPSPRLRQEAYVWQRRWTPALRQALQDHAGALDGLVVLFSDIGFRDRRPRVVRAELDGEWLRASGCAVGMALRVGAWSGPFQTDTEPFLTLRGEVSSALAVARAAGIEPRELQIDFDCATARLAGYRTWLSALRQAARPTPVTFTALPDWLTSPDFPSLADAADGWVLQVHSLERPAGPDAPLRLFDPSAARQAIAAASQQGRPFRIALPTYGYMVSFDAAGHCVDVSAEDPEYPSATKRIVRSDPAVMAPMVRAWLAEPPAAMTGIVWYRFPTDTDRLNWRWTTLESVMAGRTPVARLVATAEATEPGLWDIHLVNEGDADAPLGAMVEAHWEGADGIAADGLGGFERSVKTHEVAFIPGETLRDAVLPPGAGMRVGWVRLRNETSMQVRLKPIHE